MNLRISSIASLPNRSSLEFDSVYASSMNKTPPKADFNTSCVLIAVCPTYPATKSLRDTSMNLFEE